MELSLVVVRGLGGEPLLLLTNVAVKPALALVGGER
jgi:hypothetical protein